MKNFKGAIFDMDGTLIDSLMFWDLLWDAFGKEFAGGKEFRPTKQDDKAVRTMTLECAMDFLHKTYHIGKNGNELLEFTVNMIEDFYSNTVKTKPGVTEFLETCHKNGVKMCVASATATDLVKIALKHCGIDKYFSAVLSCADIGKGKDNPDIYLTALENLGTKKEETVVFEDSALAIETACKAGFSAVGIYDRFNYGQDTIKKLADVYIDKDETLMKCFE